LCRAIGRPDLADRDNATDLHCAISAWTTGRAAEEVERTLLNAGVAASIVAKPGDLLSEDGTLMRRGFWQSLDHSVMGRMLYQGIAAKFSATPTSYRTSAPLLGQHNDDLPTLTGLSQDDCAALLAAGVVK
jgi:crotonobetainyl-CoA:carnitine CoA-transferase CaiB-like acyl-CoA transferase